MTRESSRDTVLLLDVDNTLLDNDRFADDLRGELRRLFGSAGEARYWVLYERQRENLGYADYLGALQAFRSEEEDREALLALSAFLLDYPFDLHLYPGVLGLVEQLSARLPVVILSDGDLVFQPLKIRRSGLWQAVDGRVLICVHKQQEFAAVRERFPAQHYVMVEDKLTLLDEMKQRLGDMLTTVFVRQGHYAGAVTGHEAPADLTIDRIADLTRCALFE